MILKIRARHFRDTKFENYHDCAIVKALNEHFPDSRISEHVDWILVDDKRYPHEIYPPNSFDEDFVNATAHNFDDTVIRVVNIKGLQEPVELSTLTSRQLLQESKVTA